MGCYISFLMVKSHINLFKILKIFSFRILKEGHLGKTLEKNFNQNLFYENHVLKFIFSYKKQYCLQCIYSGVFIVLYYGVTNVVMILFKNSMFCAKKITSNINILHTVTTSNIKTSYIQLPEYK